MENPFLLRGYKGLDTFCDRVVESENLINNAQNGVDTTLISLRRQGKTGLIHHVFALFEKEKSWKTIYVDIYPCQSLTEFVSQLATSIFSTFTNTSSIGKKFLSLLKSLSVNLGFDPYSGLPEISFNYANNHQAEHSLKSLFTFIDAQEIKVLIAIDEFQQILNFPEKNIESLLRSIIQNLKNVNFIFSGSHTHLISEIFQSAKRPFFSSTRFLHLKAIQSEVYGEFIGHQFTKHKKEISSDAIIKILEFSFGHTFYVQSVCNKVFSISKKKVGIDEVRLACANLLEEQKPTFFQYRNLLTKTQWELLVALAKEEKVYQPTATKFIMDHQLGSGPSVKRSLDSLTKKEMVVEIQEENNFYYRVYDVFLLRWLQNQY